MIKSAVRIEDSDDGEDADRDFFERERELRERMARRAIEGNLPARGTRKLGTKKRTDTNVVDMGSDARGSDTEMGSSVNGVDVLGTASLEQGSQVSISSDDNTEGSDIGGISSMRPKKKRKVRRALSISSGDE